MYNWNYTNMELVASCFDMMFFQKCTASNWQTCSDLFLLLSRQPNGREVVPRTRRLKKTCIPNVSVAIMRFGQRMQVVIGRRWNVIVAPPSSTWDVLV